MLELDKEYSQLSVKVRHKSWVSDSDGVEPGCEASRVMQKDESKSTVKAQCIDY